MFSLGSVRFCWKACAFTGKRALLLESVRFCWKACAFTGKRVHSLGSVRFHWETCALTGKRVLTLGNVRLHWEACVFTGKRVLTLDIMCYGTILSYWAVIRSWLGFVASLLPKRVVGLRAWVLRWHNLALSHSPFLKAVHCAPLFLRLRRSLDD